MQGRMHGQGVAIAGLQLANLDRAGRVAHLAPDQGVQAGTLLGRRPLDPTLDQRHQRPLQPGGAEQRPQQLRSGCVEHALFVHVPAHDVPSLVATLRAQPGRYGYASAGDGTPPHFAAALFQLASGAVLSGSTYQGAAPAIADTANGRTHLMFPSLFTAHPFVHGSRLRALAVAGPQRLAMLPDVPTLAEAGVSGFEMSTWYGMFVTTGTPPEVTQRLQTELAKILKMPDIQAKLKGLGGEPGNITPDQFAQMNRQEFTRFGDLIKKANIKLE